MVIIERHGSCLLVTAEEHLPVHQHVLHAVRTVAAYLVELWHYRELLRNLVVRDLKVRYRNSVLGVLWSLANPLLMMAVFTVVFTVMTPTTSIRKFPIFILCGLLPWNFFSASVIGSIRSIVDNAPLIRKVYFPREVLPISVVLSSLVNFLFGLIVLFAFILAFQLPLTPWALLLPVVIAVQVIFTSGVALILATVNVFYRDTQVIMEVAMLAWFFMTPIFYPIDILPHNYHLWGLSIDVWRWMRILNPMASLTATYRVILYGVGFGGAAPAFDFFLRTTVTALGVLVIGALVFYRYSRVFGEEV
jgi:lipopolysaccharide transport system permease protein